MSEFLGSVWWMAVTFGLLITFHEFGHFWVARKMGVKVLRFSIGFGRPLWKHVAANGTEYVLAAIPLGGYVKMLDAREGEVDAQERHREFTGQSVWVRIAIVAAGPAFNFLFAIFAFWAMLVIGKPGYLPIVGQATELAAQAGMHPGDRILHLDHQAVQSWSGVAIVLSQAAQQHRQISIEVRTATGRLENLDLALNELPKGLNQSATLQHIGLVPQQLLIPAIVGKVETDSAAATAGLRPGDKILAIDQRPIRNWNDLVGTIHALAGPHRTLQVQIKRDSRILTLTAHPQPGKTATGKTIWLLGVVAAPYRARYDTVDRKNPFAAIPASINEVWNLSVQTVQMIGHMLNGQASLKNLSGPISIAQYANTSADLGVAWFLYFLGIVSLSLGIMNLLPIPILDGGHLLYYLIELVKGSPVSERVMIAGQYLGILLLVALMGLAFYNDLLRLAT